MEHEEWLFNCIKQVDAGDALIDARVLLEFAKDLKQLVEDFEEEMEILADRELMRQIRENKKERESGNTKIFDNIQELERELEL